MHNSILKIETKTCEKDNYELFDYEAKSFLKNSHEIREDGELFRIGN